METYRDPYTMIPEPAIEHLLEMGFTREQACEALEKCNNDVETALGYLFDDNATTAVHEETTTYGPSTQPIELDSSSGSSNRSQGQTTPFSQSPPQTGGIVIDDEIRQKIQPQYNEYSIFQDVSKFKREPFLPAMLIPNAPQYLEAFFAHFIVILHQIPSFRNAILEPSVNLGTFHPNWFKGAQWTENKDSFLSVLQKYMAFLDGNSQRFFASTRLLLSCLPKETGMAMGEIESLEDFIPCFYNSIRMEVAKVDKSDGLAKVFQTLIFYAEFNHSVDDSAFLIEAENARSTLYETLHELLWKSDFSALGQVYLTDISDVVTIPLAANIEERNPVGVKVPGEFYPQIYTQQYEPLMRSTLKHFQDVKAQASSIDKQIMALTVHGGKRNLTVIDSSIKHLRSVVDKLNRKSGSDDVDDVDGVEEAKLQSALENLEVIRAQILEKLESLTSQRAQLYQEMSKSSMIFDINILLEQQEEKPEPYVLVGAVIEWDVFYYLDKGADGSRRWVRVSYDDAASLKTFHLAACQLADVQNHIYTATKSGFAHTMALLYARKSVLEGELTPLNEDLVRFLNKDHEEVEKSQELVEVSEAEVVSDDSLIDLDTDSEASGREIQDQEGENGKEENLDSSSGESLI